MFYTIYNEGEIDALPDGQRSVMLIRTGYKFVFIVEWSSMLTAKVPLAVWERLKPLEQKLDRRIVRRSMETRLHYVEMTKLITEALGVA